MVDTQLGNILKEFEPFFQCSLAPDANDSCLVKTDDLPIQIELDRYGFVLIGCRIFTLPNSRFRSNLITAALKFNESTMPSTGIFGFSQKNQQLILYMKVDSQMLTPHIVSSIMPPFIDKAKLWLAAIAKDEIPAIPSMNNKPTGMFGLGG